MNPVTAAATERLGRALSAVRFAVLGSLLAPLGALAVYAPIPEQEQGKPLTFTACAQAGYDSNIFGAAYDPISSAVYSGSVKGSFNASLDEQSFGSAFYKLTVDNYVDRPGAKSLFSHELFARYAHSFSQATTIDLYDYFQYSRNPQSLLNGLPLNTDQSFKRNELDGRYSTSLSEKTGLEFKVRSTIYRFDNATLGRSLDRIENLYGLAGSYNLLPETKGVFEYRHQDVNYRYDGNLKDKTSDFGLAGLDYKAGDKLTASARVGFEHRTRQSEDGVTAPSAELSVKYDYGTGSFLTAGYAYLLDEASNPQQFTDSRINRFFVNLEHAFDPKFVGSLSATVEPSTLLARAGYSDVKETTYRIGGGLSYLPTKNWTVSLTYDLDRVFSQEASRQLLRQRVGVLVALVF